jgi:hypothetical protein
VTYVPNWLGETIMDLATANGWSVVVLPMVDPMGMERCVGYQAYTLRPDALGVHMRHLSDVTTLEAATFVAKWWADNHLGTIAYNKVLARRLPRETDEEY